MMMPSTVDQATMVPSTTSAPIQGPPKTRRGRVWSYQLVVAGTGSVSAGATVEVSNDGNRWETFGTLTASGTTTASDYIRGDVTWAQHRARVDSISGTGAAATVTAAGV